MPPQTEQPTANQTRRVRPMTKGRVRRRILYPGTPLGDSDISGDELDEPEEFFFSNAWRTDPAKVARLRQAKSTWDANFSGGFGGYPAGTMDSIKRFLDSLPAES